MTAEIWRSRLTFHGFALIAQVHVVNTPAATALLGLTQGALVHVVDRSASTAMRFCIARRAHVHVVDRSTAAAPGTGFAISALVHIVDGAATATASLRLAGRTQIHVTDSAAGTAIRTLTIGSLIRVIDAPAPGKRVTAEHQQHRKNQFHLTLPWVARKQPGTA